MPVSLSLHRNTVERRKRHQTSRRLVESARDMAGAKAVAGYAIVGWDAKMNYVALWETAGTISCNNMPEYVKVALMREIVRSDTQRETG